MSIPFSGSLSRSGGLFSAIHKQLRILSLKPTERITVTFDPFHKDVQSIREFLFYITGKTVQNTNPNCQVKTEVVCARQNPVITCKLITGKSLIFKTENLTVLEILQNYNRITQPLVPPEEEAVRIETKASKAARRK